MILCRVPCPGHTAKTCLCRVPDRGHTATQQSPVVMEPLNEFHPRSSGLRECISEIFGGMSPVRLLFLRLSVVSLGNALKLSASRPPLRSRLGSQSEVTMPALSQEMPRHEQVGVARAQVNSPPGRQGWTSTPRARLPESAPRRCWLPGRWPQGAAGPRWRGAGARLVSPCPC